jgi:hypothetical protein
MAWQNWRGRAAFKYPGSRYVSHLPGRGRSIIQKVDGLEESAPLHFGPGNSSIFLLGSIHVIICGSGGSRSRGPHRFQLKLGYDVFLHRYRYTSVFRKRLSTSHVYLVPYLTCDCLRRAPGSTSTGKFFGVRLLLENGPRKGSIGLRCLATMIL